MAYRSATRKKTARPAPGLIEDVVAQFADRFAYARELVQNAIDAGTTSVLVSIDEDADNLHVRFQDDGSGMPIDVIRGPLLTVFSSSKDGDASKIGKYGVGFKSVLAVDPAEVIVETHHANGSHLVRLFRDHTFEIVAIDKAATTGTTVTLVVGGAPEERVAHRERLQAALRKWCKHIRCPVLVSNDGGAPAAVNEPMTLRAPVELRLEEEGMVAVVGPSAGCAFLWGDPTGAGNYDFAGFYAHGLTLLEATSGDAVIPGVRFKVESAALSCTVSRDDVRRDRAFDAAMKLVRRAREGDLGPAIDGGLMMAARRYGETGAEPERYHALLAASGSMRAKSDTHMALLEARDGTFSTTAATVERLGSEGRAVRAAERSGFTERLGRMGVAVLRSPGHGAELAMVLDVAIPSAEEHFTLLVASSTQDALAGAQTLRAALGALGQRVDELIGVVHAAGRPFYAGVAVVDRGQDAWVLPLDARPRGRTFIVRSDWLEAIGRGGSRRLVALVARLVLVRTSGAIGEGVNDALLSMAAGGVTK